jgi:hypothetical protein
MILCDNLEKTKGVGEKSMNKAELIKSLPGRKANDEDDNDFGQVWNYGYNEAIKDCIKAIQDFDPFKIDWSTAPDWAEAHAVDGDGQGYFYSTSGILIIDEGDESEEDNQWRFENPSFVLYYEKSKRYNPYRWQQSRRIRPAAIV